MKQLILKLSITLTALLTASAVAIGQLTISVTVDKHVSCPRGDDAEITVYVSGAGEGTVILEWRSTNGSLKDNLIIDGPSAQISFPRDGKMSTPLRGGEISFRAIDLSHAPSFQIDSLFFLIHEPQSIEYSVTQPSTSETYGSIKFSKPTQDDYFHYSYSIDGGGNYSDNPLFNELILGDHLLKVRITSESTTCYIDDTVTIKPTEQSAQQ